MMFLGNIEDHDESINSFPPAPGESTTFDGSVSREGTQSDTSTGSLAHRETQIINRSKLVVYLCLVASSVVVTVSTFILVKRYEDSNFESEFLDLAHEIIDVAEVNAKNTVGQVRNLVTTIASFAANSKQSSWPNVTLPHFPQRLEETMTLTGAELMAFLPLVSVDEKDAFIEFAHNEWVRQGFTDVDDIPHKIHDVEGHDAVITVLDFHAPLWQTAPPPRLDDIFLLDLNTFEWFQQLEKDVLETHHAIMSGVVDMEYLLKATREEEQYEFHPESVILKGIPKNVGEGLEDQMDEDRVGFVMAVIPWESYFVNVIPHDIHGFLVEVNDHCGTVFTYRIDGHDVTLFGEGNLHDGKYDYLHQEADYASFLQYDGSDTTVNHCHYTLDVYPTDELKAIYTSGAPWLYASAIAVVFLFTIGIFLCYDLAVQRRQDRIKRLAKRTTNIVKSLFPKSVHARIMADVEDSSRAAAVKPSTSSSFRFSMKDRLKDALKQAVPEKDPKEELDKLPPIAELFPAVTIMFADLVGFTAWSSTREPAQVFLLLESIYCDFDDLAKRRRIFKVETVGDCYVAACGLPDPRRDHAVAMVRFARDCRDRMHGLVKKLELRLGPDTTDLGIRIGLHSGPVTGGVLRGDKARFQLFGDTMNTTARIETTGRKNMIHLSEETAHLVQQFGKGHWIQPREDVVLAKGKGQLSTFWLVRSDGPESSSSKGDTERIDNHEHNRSFILDNAVSENVPGVEVSEKIQRLVHWNSEVMAACLKEVVQRRQALNYADDFERVREMEKLRNTGVLSEMTDVFSLPFFHAEAAERQSMLPPVELGERVMQQLQSYVHSVATLYRSNPFHSFEHASHVLMSVRKLMSRIVAPELNSENLNNDRTLHDHTYGITSDPLTQFAAILAALIHDVDHQGVTNATLVEEKSSIAAVYCNKSVAEQNSVDIAWNLLMDDSFIDLRNCIYSTPAEYRRFRQLLVNLVMATDIMDKQLSTARKERWAKAFAEGKGEAMGDDQWVVNRKATIVLEHLIQASDVAHTMQHWHIYRKWNGRLFQEMMKAYKEGRTNRNPAETWYEGEIGFFDFYVIPLAKKLKECGVFGVSSDEYLNYALKNSKEWQAKGKEIVAEMIEEANQQE